MQKAFTCHGIIMMLLATTEARLTNYFVLRGIEMTINHIIFHPFGACWYTYVCINILRQRQDGRHFADYIFKCIFLNENVWILIKISLPFVPKGRVNNIPALIQIMAWRRQGDKPLFEPMMVSLLMHKCITRPQWVNTLELRQNGGHFVENIFKSIFLYENPCVWLPIL